MEPIFPISFSDDIRNQYKIIDGEIYKEITSDLFPTIRPGQYINYNGKIYDTKTNYVRRPTIDKRGYFMIELRMTDGSYYHTSVHRTIMMVFWPTEGMYDLCINHMDGVKTHNSPFNLEWTTIAENTRHAFRTGLTPTGENHHMAKLTEAQVNEICDDLTKHSYYGQYTYLSKKYNVSTAVIENIAHGRTWIKETNNNKLEYKAGKSGILDEDDVREICSELEKGRYHGQNVELARKYDVCVSTIKEIIAGRSWPQVSKDYDIVKSINSSLSEEQIHQICKIIEKNKGFDNRTYQEILSSLNLQHSSQLRHNIRRLVRRDPHCYYNITSQYKW